MKNIEIITTQNVVLQYELATVRDRILAFLLDIVILVFALSFLRVIIAAVLGSSETAENVANLIVISLFCVYSLVFEIFNKGRSIGKAALKIQVIKLAGGRATFSDYAARWAFKLIDVYFSMGGIALILIMSSARAQRTGDLIANTAVVKMVPRTNIDLRDLLTIHDASKYTPRYQQARKLHERDALLIKGTLERYRRFRNGAHVEAVFLLSQRVQEMLGIDQVTEERHVFLQTILQDYVVLSR